MSRYLLYLLFAIVLFCGTQASDDVCEQPITKGPCRGAIRRFAFNTTSQECVQFVYGGCRGNDNRFETLEECQETCEPCY